VVDGEHLRIHYLVHFVVEIDWESGGREVSEAQVVVAGNYCLRQGNQSVVAMKN
jgi:hypothetical protein